MEPTIVDRADKPPGKCLVSRDITGPFIDTGCYAACNNPYLYLSVRWIEDIAKKKLGMVPLAKVEEDFEELQKLVKEQGERLEALTRFEDAVAEYEQAKEAVYK